MKFRIVTSVQNILFKYFKTKDAYSNKVTFSIINLKTNIAIDNDFFKIPREEDL